MSSKALNNVIVVTPVIRIWSGQVTLRRNEDLSSASGLPPRTLVSDGAKRIIDPKALTPLESQRRSMNRDLARIGVKSAMGFLINPDRETEVHEEMDKRKKRFDEAKDELIFGYDALCQAWEDKNPGFETLLQRNRPKAIDVASACDFDYAIFKVEAVESDRGRERFEAAAKATASALADDVAANAKAILRDSFDGKESVTQRAVNVVRELVRKLKGFTMFDPRIAPTTDALESVLLGLPKTGVLDTSQTLILGAMLRSMCDPDQLLNLGTGIAAIDEEEEAKEVVVASKVNQPAAQSRSEEVGAAILF